MSLFGSGVVALELRFASKNLGWRLLLLDNGVVCPEGIKVGLESVLGGFLA